MALSLHLSGLYRSLCSFGPVYVCSLWHQCSSILWRFVAGPDWEAWLYPEHGLYCGLKAKVSLTASLCSYSIYKDMDLSYYTESAPEYWRWDGLSWLWAAKVIPNQYVSSSNISADWQQNIYGLNSNFGSANDLRALANAIHSRGMVSQQGWISIHSLPFRSTLWLTLWSIISATLEATIASTTRKFHLSIANHTSTHTAQLPPTTMHLIRQELKMYSWTLYAD